MCNFLSLQMDSEFGFVDNSRNVQLLKPFRLWRSCRGWYIFNWHRKIQQDIQNYSLIFCKVINGNTYKQKWTIRINNDTSVALSFTFYRYNQFPLDNCCLNPEIGPISSRSQTDKCRKGEDCVEYLFISSNINFIFFAGRYNVSVCIFRLLLHVWIQIQTESSCC